MHAIVSNGIRCFFSFLVRQKAKNITLLSIQVGYFHYIRKSSCSIIDNKLQLNMS